MNRSLTAWLVASALAVGGLLPFFTGSARVVAVSIAVHATRLYTPVAFILPPWSAVLLGASFLVAFLSIGRILGFATFSRPVLVLVAGGWTLDVTGFLRIGLPVASLLTAESVSDMFRLTLWNFRQYWRVVGSPVGWIMLACVIALAVAIELLFSRRRPESDGKTQR